MLIGITGHKGVLGTILKEKLTKNNIRFSIFEGDISIPSDIDSWICSEKLDVIYHFAAKVPVNFVDSNPFTAYKINVGGTLNLCQSLSKLENKPYLIYGSTSHVYKSKNDKISELDAIEPINFYGLTKYQGEKVVESYAKEFDAKICIARIFSFYHKTQKIPYLYPSIKNRLETEDLSKPFELRGAKSIRDISNAEEIVDKLLLLSKKEANGVYNIGSGEGISIESFVKDIANCELKITYLQNDIETYLVCDISKFNKLVNG